jgi:hypothetical protein
MKILFLGLLVAGLVSGCAATVPVPAVIESERTFDAGYDAVWGACLQAISTINTSPPLMIASTDKESGVLTTQPATMLKLDEYSECKNIVFALIKGDYMLHSNVYVKRTSETQTKVKVVVRIVMPTGAECRSNGKLEAKLLDAIGVGLSAPK